MYSSLKNKKIVIAIDSFKGSLTSLENSQIIKNGIKHVIPEAEVISIPIADGGEGTVEAFVEYLGGNYVNVKVEDPLQRIITSRYGLIDEGKTAVIEMAAASGLSLLSKGERNPLKTSTYGTGQLILDAINKNVEKIILGIGGSATNDGGIGMASALGVEFYDEIGEETGIDGLSLENIRSINLSNKDKRLQNVNISVLCDVTNPLLGINGATRVYGLQKGCTDDQFTILEAGLENLVRVVKNDLNREYENIPGAGAAGGLGYGLITFLDAEIKNGINIIIDQLNIEEKIKTADYVITGEGKMDSQTSFNKAPWGIMKLAKKYDKPVIGICAILEDDETSLLSENFDFLYSIVNNKVTVEKSMEKPDHYLFELSKRIASDVIK